MSQTCDQDVLAGEKKLEQLGFGPELDRLLIFHRLLSKIGPQNPLMPRFLAGKGLLLCVSLQSRWIYACFSVLLLSFKKHPRMLYPLSHRSPCAKNNVYLWYPWVNLGSPENCGPMPQRAS